MGWEIDVGGVVVTSGRGPSGHVTLVAHRDGEPAWRIDLDATGGRGDLMPRMQRPRRVGSRLVVNTDGEHTRGATSHEPRVHVVSAAGDVCWSKPWRVEGEVAETPTGWVMLTIPTAYRVPVGEPVAVAHLVDPDLGTEKRSWDLHVSAAAAAEIATTHWVQRVCTFEHEGNRWTARVDVRWSGKTETVRARLRGAQ